MHEQVLSFTTASAAVLLSVPYVLAALGGVCSERTGVVNIALEGMLLAGAFFAAAVTFWTGSPILGLLGAALGGVLIAILHAVVTVWCRADQIISGLALNLLAAGATLLGARLLWGRPHSDNIQPLPCLWDLPGDPPGWLSFLHAVTAQPLVLLAGVAVVVLTLVHTRTVRGLRWRAVGENPLAVDTLGLSVPGLRFQGVLLSGVLAGLGGAWLTFNVGQFSGGISAGKGYIALAAVVFGRWHPLGAAAGCLVFGASTALAEALERGGAAWVPGELVGALPYALTIVVLAGLAGRARAPAALGLPYQPAAA